MGAVPNKKLTRARKRRRLASHKLKPFSPSLLLALPERQDAPYGVSSVWILPGVYKPGIWTGSESPMKLGPYQTSVVLGQEPLQQGM